MGQQNILGTERQHLDSFDCPTACRDDSRSDLAFIRHFLRSDSLDDSNSQQAMLTRIHSDTRHMLKCDTDRVDSSDNPLCTAQVSQPGLNLEPLNPGPHLTTNSSFSSQLDTNTAVQTFKSVSAVPERTGVEPVAGLQRASEQETVSELKVAQSLTLQWETGAWTHDKPPEGMNVTKALKFRLPKVLDCEAKIVEKIMSIDSGLNYSQEGELCEAQPKASLNLEPAATESTLCPAIFSLETGETGSGVHYLSKSSPEEESTPASFTSDSENMRRARAKLSHQEKRDNLELVLADGPTSPELHSAASRLLCARAAGATFLLVSHVAMTDLCHAEEQTVSSALNTVEGGEAHGVSSTGKPVCLANATGAAAGAGSSAGFRETNPGVPSESESCQFEAVNPAGQGKQEPISGEEGPLEVFTIEDTKVNVNSTGHFIKYSTLAVFNSVFGK